MVFHMLRWEMGDDTFQKFLRDVLSTYTDKGVRGDDVQQIAEAQSKLELTAFFAQWVDAPARPRSSTSMPCIGWATTRDSARWARSAKTWTCSACRWSCALRRTARRRTADRRFRHRLAIHHRDVWAAAAHPDRSAELGAEEHSRPGGAGGRAARAAVVCAGRLHRRTGRVPESAGRQQEQLAGSVSHRRGFLRTAQLPILGKQLPRRACAAMTTRAGPRSGATFIWAISSTSPASATAR